MPLPRSPLLAGVLAVAVVTAALSDRMALAQRLNDVLGPRDVLNVTVLNQQELSGKFSIEADGTFTFPLVGRVKAAGLKPREVEDRLKQLLVQGYVRNPHIAIVVEPYRPDERVSVLGEVRVAGSYPVTGRLTLTEVLARAGSTTERAGAVAVITRPRAAAASEGPESDQPQLPEVIRANLKAVQSGAAENLLIKAGDTVYIPRVESIYVLGAVVSPGAYPFEERMTVLQALALAGGVTERGSAKKVRLIRQTPTGRKEVNVRLHELLQPSDTLVVRERLF